MSILQLYVMTICIALCPKRDIHLYVQLENSYVIWNLFVYAWMDL